MKFYSTLSDIICMSWDLKKFLFLPVWARDLPFPSLAQCSCRHKMYNLRLLANFQERIITLTHSNLSHPSLQYNYRKYLIIFSYNPAVHWIFWLLLRLPKTGTASLFFTQLLQLKCWGFFYVFWLVSLLRLSLFDWRVFVRGFRQVWTCDLFINRQDLCVHKYTYVSAEI